MKSLSFPLRLTVVASAALFAIVTADAAMAGDAQPDGCAAPRSSRSIGRSILGNVIGDIAGRAASNLGYASRYVPTAEVTDTLTTAIACHLDPEEQKKAADATLEATRGEQVGSSSSWTSETRANVSGTSTVAARNDMGDGSTCMLVDDIIIVNGEETRAQKRMCRRPPSPRYTLAA